MKLLLFFFRNVAWRGWMLGLEGGIMLPGLALYGKLCRLGDKVDIYLVNLSKNIILGFL